MPEIGGHWAGKLHTAFPEVPRAAPASAHPPGPAGKESVKGVLGRDMAASTRGWFVLRPCRAWVQSPEGA